MKNTELTSTGFSEISGTEAANLNGGGFAYDAGKFLRLLGVYIGNGTGMPGTAAAVADFALNKAMSNDL